MNEPHPLLQGQNMWCPTCDKPTQVTDTRKYQDVSQTFDFVRRQRVCRGCNYKFISIEISQEIWDKYYSEEIEHDHG